MPQVDQATLDNAYQAQQDAITNAHLAPQPVETRGPLGEMGAGIARGALVGLPSLIGGALKYASEPGQSLYNFGQGMVQSAEARGQSPNLTLHPEQHNAVTNALASGAEMVPQILPIAAAGIGAGTLGAPAALATGIGALAGGGLFGAEAGQRTLEKGRAAGVDEQTAREAARLNAGVTFAGQAALGMVGGQLLGTVGKTLGPLVGKEGQALASSALSDLAGMNGVVSPLLKQLPASAAEVVGANAAQQAASAKIEQSYGIDNTSPLDAALQSIGPSLGLTALMGPAALVGRAMGVRSAQQRTADLANGEAPPEIRRQLADQYASQLQRVDPAAAEAFRQNAQVAIDNKLHMPVDSRLLDPNTMQAPLTPEQQEAAAMPATFAGAAPEMVGPQAPATEVTAPAWTTELGAAHPREPGIDFTHNIDTSNLEIADLHGQIRQGLEANGIAPAAPMSRAEFGARPDMTGKNAQTVAEAYRNYLADPETARDLMRQDADAYDAIGREPAAPVIPDAPADTMQAQPTPKEPLANNAMADAMTAAFKKADEDRAYAEQAAKKAAETNAIGNIGAGERTAAAAEAGQIAADINAPKGRDAIVDDWKTAMEANGMDTKAQALTPFMKRLDNLGVMDMATHREQIDALQSIIDDKTASQTTRDRASMLKEAWDKDMPDVLEPTGAAPGVNTPAPANALGENIPQAAPENAAMSPKLEAVANTLESNLQQVGDVGVSTKAEMIADRVAQLRVEMNDRVNAGEKLSPLEQERAEDLRDFAHLIDNYTEGKATPADAQWVNDIAKMVDEASKPYTESLRKVEIPGPKMDDANQVDPGLLAPSMLSHKAVDTITNLKEQGSAPWVRDLAAKLEPLMGDTQIWPALDRAPEEVTLKGGFKGTEVGGYDIPKDTIEIGRATESTILHEAVHAATATRINEALAIKRASNQREAQLLKARDQLQSVYDEATNLPGARAQYGMQNLHEFVAELHSNAEFRDFLQTRGFMGRVIDAIRQLLGLSPRDNALVARAIDASEPFFSTERLNQEYDGQPLGAMKASDEMLQRTLAKVDKDALKLDPTKISLGALRGALPLQTVSYIASRARALPELVDSGFTKGLDAFQRANTSHEVVLNRLNDVGSKYITDLGRLLRPMDEAKRQGLEAEMKTIGGEASRIGFDYRMNGKDNLAANGALDPKDKSYMDEIHRRFTQLQRSNPEAAELLERGELLNRSQLTNKVATIIANLMDDFSSRARHLEAELQRMTPVDADYARKQDALNLATTDAVLASRHAAKLDLMDPTLNEGANKDAKKWLDTGAYNLSTRVQAALDDARKLPDNSPLRRALSAVDSMYQAESQHPYFSLGRDGDFFVKVAFKGVDKAANDRIQQALSGTSKVVGDLTRGDSHAFFRVGSADEAQALHDKLVTAGQGTVVDTAWGRQAAKIADVASVSPALRTLLSTIDDMHYDGLNSELRDQVKAQITRQLLSMMPETASRSASMGRRGVPGYDADFMKSFASRASGSVNDTAGMYSSRAYMAAATQRAQAIEDLNRSGSADARQRAQLIDDEINKRYSNSLKATPSDWVSTVNSLSHSFYLGMSPAFLIRTMAQPWHRGIPLIGSKFGFANAMGELIRAQATGMKLVANSVAASTSRDGIHGLIGAPVELKNLGLSPAEQAWVAEAHANGKLDLGQAAQLAHAAQGEQGRLGDAMRYASATAQYAEMSNRFGIGLAAFRLASKRPGLLAAGETPSSYALKAMELSMDDFSQSNTARAIGKNGWAGKMTPLFTQFQNYNLQTMQQIARTVHDGFFGQDKSPEGLQRAAEAKREFAGLMATTATIAGGLGMPFANAFAGVYNMLTQDEDKPQDVRIALRNWAVGTFGKEMGNVMLHGLPSLIGVDSSTFGAQGILPGSDFLADRTLWKERSETQVRNSLGPAVSLGLDLSNAVSRMADGYWMKGIEAALPVGIRSFYKTGEMLAGNGFYTDSKGNPTPMPVGASDIAWRALGFQTLAKAEQGDAQRDFIINQERLKNRKQNIEDQFVKSTMDPSRTEGAVEALTRYNHMNPLQPMTMQDIQGAVRNYYTSRALGEASGLGSPVSKRGFPVMQQEESFAAMPRPN